MKNNAHRIGFKPMTASNITAASPVVPKIYPYSTPGVTYYNNFPCPEVDNVANVKMLPIPNWGTGNGERGMRNWKLVMATLSHWQH